MANPFNEPRNRNLNSAYTPDWQDPDPEGTQTQYVLPSDNGDTRFDPFMGSQWGKWLDALGASNPGGAALGVQKGQKGGGMLPASIQGLGL